MSLFPADDKLRKLLPVFAMVTGYFPKALREMTRVCVANNVRYNPERNPADINWARGKSPDQLGSAFRHIFERKVDGTVFESEPSAADGGKLYVLAEAAWRVCAALELEIEAEEAKARAAPPTPAAARSDSPESVQRPAPNLLSSLDQVLAAAAELPPLGDVRNLL